MEQFFDRKESVKGLESVISFFLGIIPTKWKRNYGNAEKIEENYGLA